MPISNIQDERQIYTKAKQQGKSDDFIKQAVTRYRQLNAKATPEPKGVSGPAGFALGAVKSFVGGARDVAGTFQTGGQAALAAITPGKSYQDIRSETGLKSLKDETAVGGQIKEQLTPQGRAEKAGGVTEKVAEFVVPLAYGVAKAIPLAKSGYAAFKGLLTKKSLQEVLKTTPENLGKLSEAERSIYFAAKNKAISTMSTLERQALTKSTQNKIITLTEEAKTLSNQLATASRDEVLRLRPKIIQVMQKQSQTYRNIVEKELSPHKDVQIYADEMKSYFEQIYANNPEGMQNVVNKLGLQEGGVTTIGNIYKKIVSLGQEIGTAAKKGGKTFTLDEKMTDDIISNLSNFMKEKGVDLTNARQFWAKWAPIRNQLVSEAKPFIQSATQTQSFANRLIKIAQGKDINNENYIKEVEKLVGPVGKEIRTIASKLSATQKEVVATKLETEAKRISIQLSTQEARATLGEIKAEATLSAEQRTKIVKLLRNILIGIGVSSGVFGTGHFLFGGQ